MENKCKILYEGGQGEIVEKKSRFIATTFAVETEEEAIALIESTKKKYWDARHNCSAYVCGDRHQIQRCSDDGEPSGTAGRPMLEVILGEDVHNVLVVVTRYFGGTLLGTGGLVRAYTQATIEGLKNSVVIEKQLGVPLSIETDYNGIGKIQYLLGQRKIPTLDSVFTDKVVLKAMVPESDLAALKEEITESTNGKAIFAEEDSVYFAILDGQVQIF